MSLTNDIYLPEFSSKTIKSVVKLFARNGIVFKLDADDPNSWNGFVPVRVTVSNDIEKKPTTQIVGMQSSDYHFKFLLARLAPAGHLSSIFLPENRTAPQMLLIQNNELVSRCKHLAYGCIESR